MSGSQRLNSILDKAKGKEKKYDWLQAANLYGQASRAVGKWDFLKKGEIQEKISHCFYRAAFQAETREEFRRCMGLSLEAYEETAELFERLEDSQKQARTNFFKGMASYNRSWLAEDSSERKALLDECWKLEKEALKNCEETGDNMGYGKAGKELLTCLYDRLFLAWDWQELRDIFEEAVEHGEKAIEVLSEVGDEYELVRAHYMLSLHLFWAADVYESIEKRKELIQECLSHAQRALEISEKTGNLYLIGMSNWLIGWIIPSVKGDFQSSLRHCEKTLELGTKTNDKLMIARACEILAYISLWKASMEDDPNKRRNGFSAAFQYAEDALTHYQCFSYPITGMAYISHAESLWQLALDETNPEEKRVLLEKAVEVGRKDLEQAKHSGSPNATSYVLHSLSKAICSLSTLETKISEKIRMLEEASKHREENISIIERLSPFFYWNRGVSCNYSALIKAELAKMETDNREKEDLLKKAVVDMEDCVQFCKTQAKARPQAKQLASIGSYQYWFGGILNELYLLTGEKGHVERAIGVYEEAIQAWGKADLHSRIAETYWKMAKLHDHLAEHTQAASDFEYASGKYKLAAEKIPQLKTFYTDHAVYMHAWSEIEKARYYHAKGQYGNAKEYYERAANFHESTARWNYLSPNYFAWARLEEAEDLSRREQTEEARILFQQAVNLFVEAKKSIKAKLETLEASDEKEMAAELVKASDARREYCLGRIALEEARILDGKGDHTASSKKYGSAADIFHKIMNAESEQSRKELQPIVYLCQAWQKMMMAEAKASPVIYGEAAELFRQAKEYTLDQPTSVLALANSSFCKALEAGTKFEITSDMATYLRAKKHMEAAAKFYLKAGFKNASEYAKATQRLFDAYMYMNRGQMETEPEEKAQYYRIAEKLLQVSADSFMNAEHSEKSEEVRRLLESVREERELAMSLTKVLHAPTITSATTSFSTPTPTHEQAVGLERFEHADVQANLIVRVREVRIDEDVDLRMEMVNAGKAPALLIKVDEIIPEGFEVKEIPATYTVEDSYVNMRGKRLNPLKTEDVKMVVKPQAKGTFIMKPRILYIDETGKYRFHEPEPVTITVRELGLKGWIKGER